MVEVAEEALELAEGMSIQPAGLKLIPAIHEAWHELDRRHSDELGESAAEAVSQKIATIINGGNP